MSNRFVAFCLTSAATCLVVVATRAAETEQASIKLPKEVAKTFKKAFPQGKIAKVDAEQENGVAVYDIEFNEGKTEKETDIAGDGTLLEFSTAIDVQAVPEAALQAVRQAAEGAKIAGVEQVEMSHQTKDGKVVKLPQPATLYEVKLRKRDQAAEIVVATDGTVVEPAKWSARKDDGEHEEDEK